jgi:hypothetical protein
MLPLLQTAQVRRNDGTDRPAVNRAVSVPADIAKDRTDVQTRPAADATQCIPLLGIGQQQGSLIVQQHDMEFLRPVGFIRFPRPAIQGVVTRDRLARAHHRQHRQKEREILEARQHLLDADQRDHRPGQRRRQPRVALVLGD